MNVAIPKIVPPIKLKKRKCKQTIQGSQRLSQKQQKTGLGSVTSVFGELVTSASWQMKTRERQHQHQPQPQL
jgi:hypothetical protein